MLPMTHRFAMIGGISSVSFLAVSAFGVELYVRARRKLPLQAHDFTAFLALVINMLLLMEFFNQLIYTRYLP